jgi:hypothetical protein
LTASVLFRGETLLLESGGVLVWPRLSIVAVADLHLEKGSACAGRGRLVPPWDSFQTLGRLAALVRRYAPRTIIAVGDSFHDGEAAGRLSADDLAVLHGMAAGARMIWVQGNHDPTPPEGVAGDCTEAFAVQGLVFRHQAADGASGEISGHFHPKARVATRAGAVVRPCFMCSDDKIMLPSFGAYTGGLEVGSAAIARHYPRGGRAFLLGSKRVFAFDVPPMQAREPGPGCMAAIDPPPISPQATEARLAGTRALHKSLE